MITNSTPITTGIFDQLFVSQLMLLSGSALIANAYPSDGTHTLRAPIKSIRKNINDVGDIATAISSEALRQSKFPLGTNIVRIAMNTNDIDAPIRIRVDATDVNNKPLAPWVCNDARELLKDDATFAQVFANTMAAVGALFV